MEHVSVDHEDCPNQDNNSHKSHAKGSPPLHELQDHVYELHNPFKLMEVTRHRKIAEMS